MLNLDQDLYPDPQRQGAEIAMHTDVETIAMLLILVFCRGEGWSFTEHV